MLADGRMRISGSWIFSYNPHGPPDQLESSGILQKDYYSHADSAVPQRTTVTASVWATSNSSGLEVTVTESGRVRTATYGVETPPAGEPASTDRPVLWCDDQRVYAGAVSEQGWLGSISMDIADPSQMRSYPLIYDAEDLTGGYVRGWNVSGFYTRTRTVEILNPYFPRYTTTIDHYWWHIDTGGWVRRRIQHLTKDLPERAADAYFPSAAFDPNLNEWLWHSSFTESEGGSWSTPVSIVNFVNTITGAERVFSSSRYVLPRGIILPVDSHHICHLAEDYEFRLFGPGTVWNADGTTNPYIKSGIDDTVDNVSLQRLFGSTFLTTAIDYTNQRLSLSVRSLKRTVPGYVDMPLDADSEELPFVLQHPRDSILIVVRNGTSGPVISLFGPMCERLHDGKGNETGVIPASTGGYPSRDVVAALAGDTLWVAWTDERTGEPQAYVNGVRLPESRSTRFSPDAPDTLIQPPLPDSSSASDRVARYGFAIFSVSPNPAWRHADVVIGSDSIRSLHLVIYDALGRRLSESSIDVFPGVYSYQLPDVYRWSGVYYIEVSSGRIREIASHIIFPN